MSFQESIRKFRDSLTLQTVPGAQRRTFRRFSGWSTIRSSYGRRRVARYVTGSYISNQAQINRATAANARIESQRKDLSLVGKIFQELGIG